MTQESQYNPAVSGGPLPPKRLRTPYYGDWPTRHRSLPSNPKFSTRVEVTWPYEGDKSGMPLPDTSELMQQATELLQKCFDKDPWP